MCASFSGVSPVWNRRRLEESCGSLAQAQASARVDVPTAPTFFAVPTNESNTCVHRFFTRMLGTVHDRQPTVVLRIGAVRR